MSAAMILTGAPGSGKSSVLEALGTLLEIEGIEFGVIESEQLARGSPWFAAAQWLPQLAAVVALQRQAGRATFLVAATTETERELREVVDAVGAERVVVICLIPSIPGLDRVIPTDGREPVEVAGEIKALLVARGIANGRQRAVADRLRR